MCIKKEEKQINTFPLNTADLKKLPSQKEVPLTKRASIMGRLK